MQALRFLLIASLAPIGGLLGVEAAAELARELLGARPGVLGLVLVAAIGFGGFQAFRRVATALADRLARALD